MNLPYSQGPLDCRIAFIGEAPGAEEEKTGEPFVGAAGKLLDECLASVGIVRRLCYITNVVKERPRGNDIKQFIDLSRREHPHTPEWDKYVELLRDELNGCTANVLVPLGATALYALTGLTSSTKRRGSILESTLLPGRKVIPTIHPAAALRMYMYKHLIVHDLMKIKEDSEFPELALPRREILIDPSYEEVLSWLLNTTNEKEVAFDIEVVRGEVSCISFCSQPDKAISIPFHKGLKNCWSLEQETDIWLSIAKILEDPAITKIGQNLSFDATFLFQKYGIKVWPIHDTMVAHAMLYPDLPKGLDFIASTLTREPYYKDEGKQYLKIGGNDRDFWIYNAKDSAVVMEAWPELKNQLVEFGIWEHYLNKIEEMQPAMYIQARGTRVDYEGLKKASDDAAIKVQELNQRLEEQCGQRINPNSPKQLMNYFYVNKGIKPYTSRATGKPSTDVEALKRLAAGTASRAGLPEARTILDIRHITKLKGTYLDVTLDSDKRMRGSMNIVGTGDDRWSSSKTIFGTGGNRQNEPPEFKKYLGADPNYILYNVDLSKSHDVIMANIAPDQNMQKALKGDIHSVTASYIFQKPVSEISDEPGSAELGNGMYSERFWGKKANHALKYDMGVRSFAQLCELPEYEARAVIDGYHRAYPGVREYQEWVSRELSRDRILTNPFGRKVLFLDRWGDTLLRAAYAWIPLSTEAVVINQWGAVYLYKNQDIFEHLELLNVVHDSIEFQISKDIPLKQHGEMVMALCKNLTKEIHWEGRSFNMAVDAKVGITYGSLNKLSLEGDVADNIKDIINE